MDLFSLISPDAVSGTLRIVESDARTELRFTDANGHTLTLDMDDIDLWRHFHDAAVHLAVDETAEGRQINRLQLQSSNTSGRYAEVGAAESLQGMVVIASGEPGSKQQHQSWSEFRTAHRTYILENPSRLHQRLGPASLIARPLRYAPFQASTMSPALWVIDIQWLDKPPDSP